MKRFKGHYNAANPFLAWTGLAVKTSEMMLASAQVIGHRASRIAMAGPTLSERDRREFTLMGQEKLEAAAESAQLFTIRMLNLNQQLGTLAFRQMLGGTTGLMSLITGGMFAQSNQIQAKLMRDAMSHSMYTASRLAHSVAEIANTSLRPIHSRATANAKRLSRLK